MEVLLQVGSVRAEEDKVALYQLQKSKIKHIHIFILVLSAQHRGAALCLLCLLPNEVTGEAADGVVQ